MPRSIQQMRANEGDVVARVARAVVVLVDGGR